MPVRQPDAFCSALSDSLAFSDGKAITYGIICAIFTDMSRLLVPQVLREDGKLVLLDSLATAIDRLRWRLHFNLLSHFLIVFVSLYSRCFVLVFLLSISQYYFYEFVSVLRFKMTHPESTITENSTGKNVYNLLLNYKNTRVLNNCTPTRQLYRERRQAMKEALSGTADTIPYVQGTAWAAIT